MNMPGVGPAALREFWIRIAVGIKHGGKSSRT